MAMDITVSNQRKFPEPSYVTMGNFRRGVITIIDQSKLPKDALKEADNIFLYEDGMPGPRYGVDWFGTEVPNGEPIQGVEYYQTSDKQSNIVVVAGGVVYHSEDNAETWEECTGATLDPDLPVDMLQDSGYLYLTNGDDDIVRYDGTDTLVTYAALSTPSAPSPAKTGLAGTTIITYHYKVSAVNSIGFTTASSGGSIGVDRYRDAFDNSNKVTLTLTTVSGADRYDIYTSDNSTGPFYYLGSTNTLTFVDDGNSRPNPAVQAPVDNTTKGPKVAELSSVGSRMWGTRDKENPHRVWFTSATVKGAFSPAYDGGYIDWQPGGKYLPMTVEDYRSGKGDPQATVWCDSADGQGCIIQIGLETVSIADFSYTEPSAYRLPGSRGTPAPGSVVNVLNDYYYYNSQAIYNIGTRAQLQNILSTDEVSSNIRPTITQINRGGEPGIQGIYYEAKVFMSVPYGSSTSNNATIVLDTERQAWLPKAFTIGFSKFLRFTTNGPLKRQKLLALRPGDARLSEIGRNIQGDYGQPFVSTLVTGLHPVNRNRFEFEWTDEAEIEMSNPQGSVFVELLGIERSKGFRSIRTREINEPVAAYGFGWDSFSWDTVGWDDTDDTPTIFSESSVKRYFNVNKELNAVQWRIRTNTINARYVLRTLQTSGTPTFGGKPRAWKL